MECVYGDAEGNERETDTNKNGKINIRIGTTPENWKSGL